jgi:hypothetical protein
MQISSLTPSVQFGGKKLRKLAAFSLLALPSTAAAQQPNPTTDNQPNTNTSSGLTSKYDKNSTTNTNTTNTSTTTNDYGRTNVPITDNDWRYRPISKMITQDPKSPFLPEAQSPGPSFEKYVPSESSVPRTPTIKRDETSKRVVSNERQSSSTLSALEAGAPLGLAGLGIGVLIGVNAKNIGSRLRRKQILKP